ncbi:F-box protein At5g06550 [Amborella trichopoda]|uniref:JmjC domain-containing protein n=2 Tax=Amborella trichopoda TaxID=13333 RepID=W1NDJ5_AMBTC|nr:F-box protein At5g06550 [Amborella trichopoda]ERM93637.1 hypothetical protein AMTR_s00004p00149580 [Amborella trichopoda]|eukprot:XP_006826400.1 F-box protein At5g06550 [Amborella trichopoda]
MKSKTHTEIKLSTHKPKHKKKKKKNKSEPRESQNGHYTLEQDDLGDPAHGFSLQANHSLSHGVQPLGNLLLNASSANSRHTGLGALYVLTDELIVDILGLLGAKDLSFLSVVSKAFYVFSNHEPLWRELVLEHLKGEFSFVGSWKNTYILSLCPCFPIPISSFAPKIRDFYSDYLFQSWLCANLAMKPEWLAIDNVDRKSKISVEEFITLYEEPNKPVILANALENWPAMEKWIRDYLLEVSGDVAFSAGPVEMKLSDYFRYADNVKEERPLYLFDPKFGEKIPKLSADYKVPDYFSEDLFSLLGPERPDYRWLIIGSTGSGSSFHIDPNSTSAWNAVIRGSKKWVLFPPDVVPPGVHPSPDGAEVACPVSIMEWFMNFYGATKKWKRRPVECVCKAGEVIFVPNGWWHLVINLEESIAITQNYVSRRNLLNVLDFLKKPNAKELVSGTRDRVNLHEKFRSAYEAAFPGSIQRLIQEKQSKEKKSISFWDSVTDAKVGGFKFGF